MIDSRNVTIPLKIDVSADAVYSELYAEMRRYRDYELTVSNWYTSVMLALLAGVVTAKYASGKSVLAELLSTNLSFQVGIVMVTTFLLVSAAFSMWYAASRYNEMRSFVDVRMEPTWKHYKHKRRRLVPRHFIIGTLLSFALLIDVLTLW